jgi:hypothetical protein
MTGRDVARSSEDGEVVLLFDVARDREVDRSATLRPAGPVWTVTSVLPSILPAIPSRRALVLQNFTPPLKPSVKVPLPRPPAWICDFTMRRAVREAGRAR